MPFTFKLSQRLARMRLAALTIPAAAAVLTACDMQRNPGTGVDDPVTQVIVSPDSLMLDPLQSYQFHVFGRTQAGDSVPVSVRWAASAGPITQSGMYTADTSAADVLVTATLSTSAVNGTSSVKKRRLIQIVINPKNTVMPVGGVQQFAVYGRKNTGDSVNVSVTYGATGGAISGSGAYTAGQTAGAYQVIARQSGGSLADTSAVTVEIVPVASVAVSPASATVPVGQTVQLAATPKDASGNALSGRVVMWTTSNAAVGTVNASGLVTGVTAGSATITATSEGQGGTAAITVTATVTNPGAVANLTVASVTTNSVTLSFTEVTDGTGQPASYDIRWAAGTLSWPSATSVAQGTCTVPVAGTAIGATRTCTVLGLAASTGYQFQLVAFRGTLNVNAVFGPLSNVASGTTAASTAPVATVTVSPASASLGVGATQPFTATLRDAGGNILTGRTVTWGSSAPLVASVTGGGLVSALVVGSATITATSEGQSGSAAVTVTTGTGNPSLNEPPGFRALNDQPWDLLTGSGWSYLRRTSSKDDGIVLDATAPRSAADVLRIVFTTDMIHDTEPSVHWIGLPGVREIYTVWWMKVSPNWECSPAGCGKITFHFTNGSGQVYTGLYHQGGNPSSGWINGPPYRIGVNTEWAPYGQAVWLPNATTTFINPGEWHRIEVYYRWETTPGSSGDGIIRWWVDGVLNGNYTNVHYPSGSFNEFQYAPTLQNPPSAEMYMYLDHTYASVP